MRHKIIAAVITGLALFGAIGATAAASAGTAQAAAPHTYYRG